MAENKTPTPKTADPSTWLTLCLFAAFVYMTWPFWLGLWRFCCGVVIFFVGILWIFGGGSF